MQYIWKLQHFNHGNLRTVQDEPLRILYPGRFNTHQGPDFQEGKALIGNTLWAGNIELHVKTSDWKRHAHSEDANYRNVILHVVWENDQKEEAPFGLPTLELAPRVSKLLLHRYRELMTRQAFIPCERALTDPPPALLWSSWKDRMLAERLQRRAAAMENMLKENNGHWEEAFWWLIARSFGSRVNAEAFEAIARSIPSRLLSRHRQQPHQVEALLFGQAGLLQKPFEEAYPVMLQREYAFLRHKYSLQPVSIPLHFLRMRPLNFPSVRLAQLAVLVAGPCRLFSKVLETKCLDELEELLRVTANDYWHYHFSFDAPAAFRPKRLGREMVQNILINTLIPVLYGYGAHYGYPEYIDRALGWLWQLPPERNAIIRGWKGLELPPSNAFESQALLELRANYCDGKRCLDCAVGNWIIGRATS